MENEFYFIAEDHTKPPAQKGGGMRWNHNTPRKVQILSMTNQAYIRRPNVLHNFVIWPLVISAPYLVKFSKDFQYKDS